MLDLRDMDLLILTLILILVSNASLLLVMYKSARAGFSVLTKRLLVLVIIAILVLNNIQFFAYYIGLYVAIPNLLLSTLLGVQLMRLDRKLALLFIPQVLFVVVESIFLYLLYFRLDYGIALMGYFGY